MKAGFIGLGAMGSAMARNVAESGYLSAVWNRTSQSAAKLAQELGVIQATNPIDLAEQSDIVLCCVSDDVAVLETVNALLPGLHPGCIVVDLSTVSSETAKCAAKTLAQVDTEFLDCPVSGGVEGARGGALALMVGGDKTVLERAKPVLMTMGKRIAHMGPVGAGQSTKAVNQIMAAGINQAVTEALAFGQYQELPMDKLIDIISKGAAGNWFLAHRGQSMTQDRFAPGFKLALHHKDLKICKAMAERLGAQTGLIDRTVQEYETLMGQGFGDEDISSLYRLKRPQ